MFVAWYKGILAFDIWRTEIIVPGHDCPLDQGTSSLKWRNLQIPISLNVVPRSVVVRYRKQNKKSVSMLVKICIWKPSPERQI
jgi:hypothetical protein